MDKDPIVEEVRKAGERIADKCKFDADVFIAYLRKNQKKSGRKIVSFSNRSHSKSTAPVSIHGVISNCRYIY
jgi:hypothetical protein